MDFCDEIFDYIKSINFLNTVNNILELKHKNRIADANNIS